MSFNKRKYDDEYHKMAYDRVVLNIPKGKRNTLKKIASEYGISVNQLIIRAIEQTYSVDLSRMT